MMDIFGIRYCNEQRQLVFGQPSANIAFSIPKSMQTNEPKDNKRAL